MQQTILQLVAKNNKHFLFPYDFEEVRSSQMTSLTYLVVNGLAGVRGTQLEWFISASQTCPPGGLTRFLPMLVGEFQRAAKENKLQCISPFQTFTCVTFAKIPLAKASCMAKLRASMGGITRVNEYWKSQIGPHYNSE